MDSYDSRRITLDPGLTVLALRGLHSRREHYPFIERHARWRDLSLALRKGLVTWFPTIRTLVTVDRSVG
jgi:hypothetical protein